jgi:hypothetical protein
MGRKITILGMGPSASERRHDIVRYVEGTEVWSMNNAYLTFPKLRENGGFARLFELHSWRYLRQWKSGIEAPGDPERWDHLLEKFNAPRDHFEALHALGCQVVVQQPLPVVRNQLIVDLMSVFRHFKTNYFLGSPSLMLAIALWEHDCGDTIDAIQSFGIDTSDPQHGQQRASWAFWISKAIDRDIRIGIHPDSTTTNFMAELERDDGLRGLREFCGDRMTSATADQQNQHEEEKT